MKIPLGTIAKWAGNAILAAFAQAAIDRLSRPRRPPADPAPAWPSEAAGGVVLTPQGLAVVDGEGRVIGYVERPAQASKKAPEAPVQEV
ncbi:MAG: hypothetical protein WBL20_23625 [Sphingobium sp.]|uniref:hypothetical protein n=1 Tax=Sphingobium sp. TaxID=1912891 RepID=UPI002E224DAB